MGQYTLSNLWRATAGGYIKFSCSREVLFLRGYFRWSMSLRREIFLPVELDSCGREFTIIYHYWVNITYNFDTRCSFLLRMCYIIHVHLMAMSVFAITFKKKRYHDIYILLLYWHEYVHLLLHLGWRTSQENVQTMPKQNRSTSSAVFCKYVTGPYLILRYF